MPYYGLHLGLIFAEFSVAIFAFLVSAAPLYMLRRFYTLALATGLALAVTLASARLVQRHHRPACAMPSCSASPSASGAMVVIAASYVAVRTDTDPKHSTTR